MWPSAKIFFTSKFSYLFICNPTHKTETGTANRWGTTNSKPPGPIIMMGQSETLTSTQIVFITLQVHAVAGPFTSYHKRSNLLSQTGIVWLFFIQIYCAGSHIERHWRCTKSPTQEEREGTSVKLVPSGPDTINK
jgi:hypothetical protein